MPKFFPGVTHAIVSTVYDKIDMDSMKGVLAFVEVCFGPGDDSSLCRILIKKMDGPTAGVTAHVPNAICLHGGKKEWLPIAKGAVADELKMLALIAFDRVKSAYGLKFNKTFRVLAKSVEEIGIANVASNG